MAAWRERDLEVLRQSAGILAQQLAALARDEEVVPTASFGDKARRWIGQARGQDDAAAPAERRAQEALSQRLDAAVRASTAALVTLHGLTGSAGEELLRRIGQEFDTRRAPDADRATLWGGLVTGALSGLAADLAAGGLTFGAGAVLGGVAGAFGARKLTQLYNAERGVDTDTVRWSDEFLDARLESALVRYLAVAHFGRGRGEFQAGEPPAHWLETVRRILVSSAATRGEAWRTLRSGGDATAALQAMLERTLWGVLAALYPAAAQAFRAPVAAGADP